MTDGDALLAAILANPEEDTPRLVYADWLQENGDEARAEFIRIQCELYRRFPDHCGFPADKSLLSPHELILDHRCRQLMTAHGNDWFPMTGPQIIHLVYRGFICRIICDWADWRDHAKDILARHPVREVTLTDWPEMTFGMEQEDMGTRLWGQPMFRAYTNARLADGDSVRIPEEVAADGPHGVVKWLLAPLYPGIVFALPRLDWWDGDPSVGTPQGVIHAPALLSE